VRRKKAFLKLMELLLRHVVPLEDHEHMTGDFEEILGRITGQKGKTTARIWYACQILRLIPGYLKSPM